MTKWFLFSYAMLSLAYFSKKNNDNFVVKSRNKYITNVFNYNWKSSFVESCVPFSQNNITITVD